MVSDYYDDSAEEKVQKMEELRDTIKPINTKDEMQEVRDLVEELTTLIEDPVDMEFDPEEFYHWLDVSTNDKEETIEQTNGLLLEHSREYTEWLREEV